MSRNASSLVKKLGEIGIIVHGQVFHIRRNYGQPMMNKAYGEAAPCWELLVNPLVHTLTRKIVAVGNTPTFDMPDGIRYQREIYSHFPLLHILKTPIDKWDVGFDEIGRLWVGTTTLPSTW